MGYYVPGPAHGKIDMLVKDHEGVVMPTTPKSMEDVGPDRIIVCVVENHMFEAAGVMFDGNELNYWTRAEGDYRPKTWLSCDRETVSRACGLR